VHQDSKVDKVFKDRQVLRGHKVLQVQRELKVWLVRPVRLVLKAHKDLLVLRDHKGLKVPLVL
jgi:hypothetical protein